MSDTSVSDAIANGVCTRCNGDAYLFYDAAGGHCWKCDVAELTAALRIEKEQSDDLVSIIDAWCKKGEEYEAALLAARREVERMQSALRAVHDELYANASVSLEFAVDDLTSKRHHTEKTVGLVKEAQESIRWAITAARDSRIPNSGQRARDVNCVAQWFEDSWTGSTDEPVYQAAMRLRAALATPATSHITGER